MRRAALLFLALMAGAIAALPARAQIQVGVATQRSDFLLYERVDLYVTVTNTSGTDIVLDNNEGHPWLSFLVSKHNRLPVRPERDSTFAAVPLKAGEAKTLKVNLTPLFAFREEGQYTAAAVVDLPGAGQAISANVPFTVMEGRTVWSQQRPVDTSERTYSLVRFSPDANTTRLYLRVVDPAENVVYANLALGDLVSSVDPQVSFDPKGNIHVLQPVALGSYLYTRADPDGKILVQDVFKTYQQIRPQLYKVSDGNVTVMGGLEENPNTPQERLSQAQKGVRAPAPTAIDGSAVPAPDSSGASADPAAAQAPEAVDPAIAAAKTPPAAADSAPLVPASAPDASATMASPAPNAAAPSAP
jgi:hypothetical protein